MLTLKEQKKIRDYLESKGVDIMGKPDYSCMVESEFYEGLMDKYGLYWHKGEIYEPEEYDPDVERLWRMYKGLY